MRNREKFIENLQTSLIDREVQRYNHIKEIWQIDKEIETIKTKLKTYGL